MTNTNKKIILEEIHDIWKNGSFRVKDTSLTEQRTTSSYTEKFPAGCIDFIVKDIDSDYPAFLLDHDLWFYQFNEGNNTGYVSKLKCHPWNTDRYFDKRKQLYDFARSYANDIARETGLSLEDTTKFNKGMK